jgi:D-alanyl-D-alanine carboxypeptidase
LPSLGSVDSLVPIAAAPPNLREDICGKNHPRPPAEEAEGEGEAAATPDDAGGQRAFLLSSLRGPPKGSLLTSGLAAAIPPVDVYVGPTRAPGAVTLTASAPAAARKKPDVAAAKPPASNAAKPSAKHAKPSADAAPATPTAPTAAAPTAPAASTATHASVAPSGLKPWPGERPAPKAEQ